MAQREPPRGDASRETGNQLPGHAQTGRNQALHGRRISEQSLAAPGDNGWKLRRLVRIVHQHVSHRQSLVSARGKPKPVPKRKPYPVVKQRTDFPLLEECARHLLSLRNESVRARRHFFANAYLGAAFDLVTKHWRAKGIGKLQHVGQLSYGALPIHTEIFKVVKKLEQKTDYTVDGRPRPYSNAKIARRLNKLSYLNMRVRPFNFKNVADLRRSPAYQRFAAGAKIVLPNLPNGKSSK